EPNPDYARFARWMLRGRAEVHQVALSDTSGRGTLHVPLSDQGMVLHLAGSLKRTHAQFAVNKTYEVAVRTLDDFDLSDVRFIKADVEGSERVMSDPARDRPTVLPSKKDSELAREASRAFSSNQKTELRVLVDGKELVLPRAATRLIHHLLTEMAQGNAVTLIPIHAEL